MVLSGVPLHSCDLPLLLLSDPAVVTGDSACKGAVSNERRRCSGSPSLKRLTSLRFPQLEHFLTSAGDIGSSRLCWFHWLCGITVSCDARRLFEGVSDGTSHPRNPRTVSGETSCALTLGTWLVVSEWSFNSVLTTKIGVAGFKSRAYGYCPDLSGFKSRAYRYCPDS